MNLITLNSYLTGGCGKIGVGVFFQATPDRKKKALSCAREGSGWTSGIIFPLTEWLSFGTTAQEGGRATVPEVLRK